MLSLLLIASALAAGWPALDSPARSSATAPSDAAVVVGAEHYAWLPRNPNAQRDANLFSSWLVFSRGVPVDRITRLSDPNAPAWMDALDRAAAKVGPDGTLWVYFAGHGTMSPMDGVHALLPANAHASDTSVSVERLQTALARSAAARVVLILDTSFAGVGRGGVALGDARTLDAPEPAPSSDPRVITWVGTGPLEFPAVLDPVEHGAFTWHVVGALRGWADGTFGARDGRVTVEEAQAWVRRRLSALRLNQTPSLDERTSARAAVLSTLSEPEPDLSALDAGDQPPDDPVLAQQRAQEAARRNVRTEYEREVRSAFHKQSDAEWPYVYSFARTGAPEGLQELRDYLARFSAVSYTLPDGSELTLSSSHASEARRLLQTGGRSDAPLLDVIRVDPATFRLGSPIGEPGRGADETLHEVTLTRAFEISRTEVSQRLWTTVMGSNPSAHPGDALPVERVTWFDAIAFCNALSKLEGLQPAYALRGRTWSWDQTADGYRLPTEAEWTLAAQPSAPAQGAEACGRANVRDQTAPDGPGQPGPMGVFTCEDGYATTSPVRAFPADSSGLYGTIGNVAEWVWDAWTPWEARHAVDPAPDAPDDQRVVKGGSFLSAPHEVRLASRKGARTHTAQGDLGFRVARTVP